MDHEEKIFELMTKMYSEMQQGFEDVNNKIEKVDRELQGTKNEVKDVKNEVKDVKNTVTRIEHDHGQKLGVLFDGYKQNSDKLDRIETEVSKHEEIILRRVR